jgi:hypothetical protein
MNYEQFLEQMKEDLTERFTKDLPPEFADVRIGIRDVEKLQGKSYRGLSFRSGDSPVEIDLNMMEDRAPVYRLDTGDRAGNKMTSAITNRQPGTFGISSADL